MTKNSFAMPETWVPSLGRENPLEKGMAPIPISSPGEAQGQRSLVGHSPGVAKSDTTEVL